MVEVTVRASSYGMRIPTNLEGEWHNGNHLLVRAPKISRPTTMSLAGNPTIRIDFTRSSSSTPYRVLPSAFAFYNSHDRDAMQLTAWSVQVTSDGGATWQILAKDTSVSLSIAASEHCLISVPSHARADFASSGGFDQVMLALTVKTPNSRPASYIAGLELYGQLFGEQLDLADEMGQMGASAAVVASRTSPPARAEKKGKNEESKSQLSDEAPQWFRDLALADDCMRIMSGSNSASSLLPNDFVLPIWKKFLSNNNTLPATSLNYTTASAADFNADRNLALGAVTRQSSTAPTPSAYSRVSGAHLHASHHAVDGFCEPNEFTTALTQEQSQPWWEVDLGQPVLVKDIVVVNRRLFGETKVLNSDEKEWKAGTDQLQKLSQPIDIRLRLPSASDKSIHYLPGGALSVKPAASTCTSASPDLLRVFPVPNEKGLVMLMSVSGQQVLGMPSVGARVQPCFVTPHYRHPQHPLCSMAPHQSGSWRCDGIGCAESGGYGTSRFRCQNGHDYDLCSNCWAKDINANTAPYPQQSYRWKITPSSNHKIALTCDQSNTPFTLNGNSHFHFQVAQSKDLSQEVKQQVGQRLYPCWIMASNTPFADQKDDTLADSKKQAAFSKRFTASDEQKDRLRLCWHVDGSSSRKAVRYVRVQMEGQGSLGLTQVLVFGSSEASASSSNDQERELPLTAFHTLNCVYDGQPTHELVALINRVGEKLNLTAGLLPSFQDAKHVEAMFAPEGLARFADERLTDRRHMELRVQVLCEFNNLVMKALPLVDLTLPRGFSTLADDVRSVRDTTLWSIKQSLWNQALEATICSSGASGQTLHFDLLAASEVFEKKRTDHRARRTVFGQAYQQRHLIPAERLRLRKSARAFTANMVGFRSTDAGGPYRDVIEQMCRELQSPALPLFIVCPNGRSEMGENRDRYVPRPDAALPLHASLYEFLGQLMGLAIRTKNLLNLNFPSMVWKLLVGDVVTDQDVRAIDVLSAQLLDLTSDPNMTQQQFESQLASSGDIVFQVPANDGSMHELVPNGASIRLTWQNRALFAQQLRRFRYEEFVPQCQAMRRGLAQVVPIALLSIFTWRELETQVCGRGLSLDAINLLEKMTNYSGYLPSDAVVINFWRMMRERMDEDMRAKLLTFVWGRSRLPVNEADFERKFTITRISRSSADKTFPIAHTCGFSVDVPPYSSLDVMHDRFSYAINNCGAIDADGGGPRDGARVNIVDNDEEESFSLF